MQNHLKGLKRVWADSCRTMWIEILALRNLEGFLKGRYFEIPQELQLTDIIFAPECKGRLNSLHKDYFLENTPEFINNLTTMRVVLLSAAFEAFFYGFLDDYLKNRPKYFDTSTGTRTAEGNQVYGQVKTERGLVPKIQAFANLTNSKTKSIAPKLPVLNEVYTLRNIIAHNAGICDTWASQNLSIVPTKAGERIIIPPDVLIQELAPPCLEIAESLSKKIIPAPLATV